MDIAITAIGTANPPFKHPQQTIIDTLCNWLKIRPAKKRILKSIYKSAGIDYRYTVLEDYSKKPENFDFFPKHPDSPFPSTAERMKLYKQHAVSLAIQAIEKCLASNNTIDKQDITHLISVSCTGMYAPGIDIEIVQKMKLNPSTKRTSINFMGCYGAFNGLKVAESICKGNPNAKVLVVCVELCSIHFQKEMTTDNMISNALFSDGAAAVLIQSKPQLNKYLKLEAFHCDLMPQTDQEMTWQIGDSGFDIVLSSYVPDVIKSGIGNFTKNLLTHYGSDFSNIDFYAIHPGGIKILQGCEASLDLKPEDNKYSYQVLRNYGNMSSATVLFVLKAIWNDIQKKDHDKTIFSCAFGPGLTLESMILKTHSI